MSKCEVMFNFNSFRNSSNLIRRKLLLILILIVQPIHIVNCHQDTSKHKTNADYDKEDIDNEDYYDENIEYKYVASSTHHIGKLFDLEKELVYRLLHGDFSKLLSSKERQKIDIIIHSETNLLGLKEFEGFFRNETAVSYVKHPVNAFHLIKRTTQLWPKILLIDDGDSGTNKGEGNAKTSITPAEARTLRSLTNFIIRKFPANEDFYHNSAIGLMMVENTYARKENLRLDLANGILHDKSNRKIYESRHQLSPADCLSISTVAQNMLRLENYNFDLI